MKKILEKIISVTLALISLLFVALLLLLMFKPEYVDSLNNQLVKTLIIIFTVLFALLSGINIYTAFVSNDKLAAVLLFKGKASATKATVGVVKSYVKKSAKEVEGARITKVALFVDENNDVRLKANLKIKGTMPVMDVVTRVKAVVTETIFGVLGLEFKTIDFTMTGVKNEFKPDARVLEDKIAKEKEEIVNIQTKERQAREALEEKEAITEEPLDLDNQTDITQMASNDSSTAAITDVQYIKDTITESAPIIITEEEAIPSEEVKEQNSDK